MGNETFNAQQLYLLHLKAGSGASVRVRVGEKVSEGTWVVSENDFFIRLAHDEVEQTPSSASQQKGTGEPRMPDPGQCGSRVEVFLNTGIHSFQALMKPSKDGLWKVVVLGPIEVTHHRRSVRVPLNAGVVFRLLKEGCSDRQGKAVDIGYGGLGFTVPADADLKEGDQIELEFTDGPWAKLKRLTGTVMWNCARDGNRACGVAFRDMSEEQKRLMVHLVATELRKQKAGKENADKQKAGKENAERQQ